MTLDIHTHDLRSWGEEAARLREAVAGCVVTAQSDDYAFRVTVAPGGAVTEVEFSERAFTHTCKSLSRLVTETIQEAAAQVAASVSEGTSDLVGGRVDIPGILAGKLPAPPQTAEYDSTDSSSVDVSQVPAALDSLQAEAKQRFDSYSEIREELCSLVETAWCSDRSVNATVRFGGAVDKVEFTSEALRHGPATLDHLLMSAIRLASARIAVRSARQVKPLTGRQLDIEKLVSAYLPEDMKNPDLPDQGSQLRQVDDADQSFGWEG
jgi:DNA-binding protein YbaB